MLSSLLKEGVQKKQIHGIQVVRKALAISHLFFADDSLLFLKESSYEAECIMNILKKELSSGQVVNLDKSKASFSQNVREEDKDMIRSRMGVKTMQRHSKYLGLPIMFGRSEKEIYGLVIKRV